MGACIKLFLDPFNVAVGGFTLTFPSGTTERIFLNRPICIQDLGAHQSLYHFTGSGGHKFCLKCLNTYARKSNLVDEDGDDLIRCDCITRAELDRAEDADVLTAVDRLAEKKLVDPPEVFQRRQTALGYTYHPFHFLYDAMIRAFFQPISGFMHDWMHCMLVQGVVNTTLFLIMEDFRAIGQTYAVFEEYLGKFKWPLLFSGKPDVLCKKRVDAFRKAKKANERRQVKMQASEGLQILPVMALFVMLVIKPSGRAAGACAVFLAMHGLLELLIAIPHGYVTEAMLLGAVEDFLKVFRDVYGTQWMHNKFHSLLHLPEELFRCGVLLTCWVHERKHKVVKEFAEFIRNTRAYERGVVSEAVCKQLAAMRQPSAFRRGSGLVRPSPCPRRVHAYLVELMGCPDVAGYDVFHGAVMKHSQCTASKRKDVVLMSGRVVDRPHGEFVAGEVLHHLEVHGRPQQVPLSIVSVWEVLELNAAKGYAVWKLSFSPRLVDAELILEALVYRAGEDEVLTLIPARFR